MWDDIEIETNAVSLFIVVVLIFGLGCLSGYAYGLLS